MAGGCADDFLHRCVADASGWVVDDASQGLLVVGVGDGAEIGDDVLDLLALIERQAAVDAVGDVVLAHLFLEAAALGVGAVEDDEVAVLQVLLTAQPTDVVAHDHRLLAVALCRLQLQLLAVLVLAIDVLRYLSLVLADEAVGGLDDELCGAVVLLQLEEAGVGVGFAEVEDIVDVGAAEAVDALGIVAHHADALVLAGEQPDDALLGEVGVLILVDEHILEFPDVFLADVLVLVEEQEGLHQQVVEVHRVGLTASHRVHLIYVDHLRVLRVEKRTVRKGVGQDEMVFRHRYLVGHRIGLVHLVVELHLADDVLHQRAGIALVVDGEVRLVADGCRLAAQDTCEDAVESAHLQIAGTLVAHQSGDALLHLASRLVGEGQGEDIPRCQIVLLQQIGNLIGEDSRLARARTSYNQLSTVAPFHGLALAVVELF